MPLRRKGEPVQHSYMSETQQLIQRLEETRDQTLDYFALPEEDLARQYATGRWTVRFILHHLADAETVFFDRIGRILSEPRQVIWSFDQDAWAKGLDYSRRSLALSRPIFEAVRNAIIDLASLHYERNGGLEFVHSQTGVRTLKQELEKVAAHNANHLSQIRTALARGESL